MLNVLVYSTSQKFIDEVARIPRGAKDTRSIGTMDLGLCVRSLGKLSSSDVLVVDCSQSNLDHDADLHLFSTINPHVKIVPVVNDVTNSNIDIKTFNINIGVNRDKMEDDLVSGILIGSNPARFLFCQPIQSTETTTKSKSLKVEAGGLSELLTNRQYQVMSHAASGKSNDEIARDLNIAVSTVNYHLSGVFEKLGVKRRSQLSGMMSS